MTQNPTTTGAASSEDSKCVTNKARDRDKDYPDPNSWETRKTNNQHLKRHFFTTMSDTRKKI